MQFVIFFFKIESKWKKVKKLVDFRSETDSCGSLYLIEIKLNSLDSIPWDMIN